jgi:L-seryl-tRNA(Ser) seleniumtransferase
VEGGAVSLRDLPSVDRLLQAATADGLEGRFGRPLTLQALQETLHEARALIRGGGRPPDETTLIAEAAQRLQTWVGPTLRPVINATGVILHTNLGRAPLSRAATQAMLEVASGYSTLEYDLAAGKRGSREAHAEALLRRLLEAEAALVVNNNAAAVLLALTALARRREVVIARSQLVEIGGGFRIPDVMKESGARLVEVGTTNRTHLRDFEAALTERTALLLRAHHSNFRIVGFTTEPGLSELVALAQRHALPVVDDLGSGALLDTAAFGLAHEPTVQESLRCGAALVAFSGDKLLGGPQAGILVGAKEQIDHLRRHPLARAVRPDKLCLAALTATLTHYLQDEATREIPVWRMIAARPEDLRARAAAWAAALQSGEVIQGQSTVGGGSLPEETLPTWLLALDAPQPNRMAERLRLSAAPVIARVEEDRLVLDPRTVLPEQETALLAGISAALRAHARAVRSLNEVRP